MASMAEMVALQEQIASQGVLIQELQSRIDVQDERIRAIGQEQSRPGSGGAVGAPAVDRSSEIIGTVEKVELVVTELDERLLKLEVDAAKGKRGRKPDRVVKAMKAEEEAA